MEEGRESVPDEQQVPIERTFVVHWVYLACAKVSALLRRGRLDQDFEQELASHVEMAADEYVRRGLSRAQARRAALMDLGGMEAARLLHRDTRGVPPMDTLLQDLRYTARTLRRDAGFATIAVLILAIGIGANTAIFSLVHALLLRPLAFPHADRLVWIEGDSQSDDPMTRMLRPSTFQEWQALNRSFEDMGAFFAPFSYESTRLVTGAESERLVGVRVAQSFFSTLGVQPVAGRWFTEAESRQETPSVVLISHRLWTRRFQSNPLLVGQVVRLNDAPVTVVGILPASFDFGSVFAPGSRVDLWTPFPAAWSVPPKDGWSDTLGSVLSVVGRLKPGVSLQSARADLEALTVELRRLHPNRGVEPPRLVGLQEQVSGRWRGALLLLACAVGAVLLIVCANLSNLLLARAASRQPEIALRTALGATRARLVRQLLTESLVLSVAGGALGLIVAVTATRAVTRLPNVSLPLLQTVEVDGTALAFTAAITLITGLLFGLVPALQMSGTRPQDALRQASRGGSGGARAAWIRRTLVVSEIAVACVLLVTAGLLLRSFVRVLDVDPGFEPARVATLRVDPGASSRTPGQRNAFYDEAVARVETVPGIQSAALTDALPFDRNRIWTLWAEAGDYPQGPPMAYARVVSRGYFETMGIPIVAGTDFTGQETRESEPVVIINETAARTLWPDRDPIGQVARGGRFQYRVIGVVGDVRHRALEEASGLEMYIPLTTGRAAGAADLVMRTTLPPSTLAASLRAALHPLDPTLPTAGVQAMQDLVDRAVSPRRFVMWLLAAFAVQALVLACLGIYGVISYAVTERTREIGIRMALGATTGDVQRRVLRETFTLAAVGAMLGLIGAFAAGRVVASLLFDLSATDPLTFVGMFVVLTIVALVAGYVPARRAARIDAMMALRAG